MSNLVHCVDNKPDVFSLVYYKDREIHKTCVKLCSLKFPDDFLVENYNGRKSREGVSSSMFLFRGLMINKRYRRRYVDVLPLYSNKYTIKPEHQKLYTDILKIHGETSWYTRRHGCALAIKTCFFDDIALRYIKKTYEKNKSRKTEEHAFSNYYGDREVLELCFSFNLVKSAKFIIDIKPRMTCTVINQICFLETNFPAMMRFGHMESFKFAYKLVRPEYKTTLSLFIKKAVCKCPLVERWFNDEIKIIKKTLTLDEIMYTDEEDIIDDLKQTDAKKLCDYFSNNYKKFDPVMYPVLSSILMKNLVPSSYPYMRYSRGATLSLMMLSHYKDVKTSSMKNSFAECLIYDMAQNHMSTDAIRTAVERLPSILHNISHELSEIYIKTIFKKIKDALRYDDDSVLYNYMKNPIYNSYNHIRNNIDNKLNQEILSILIPFDLIYAKYITNLDDASTNLIIGYI